MCEEIQNASTVVLRSLMWNIEINGILGLAMFIAIEFCIGNVEKVFENFIKFPFIDIFKLATGFNGGATAMSTLIQFFIFFAIIAIMAAVSKMMWVFSRDKKLLFSILLSRVNLHS